MKMKMLAASLLLAAGAVQAAPVTLFLDNITFQTNNTGGIAPFFYVGIGASNLSNPGGVAYINGACPSCGDFTQGFLTGQGGGTLSSAVIDGSNVTLNDVAWGINNVFGQNYNLSFDAALTIIGDGVALVKSGVVCTNFAGTGVGTTCADQSPTPFKAGYGFNFDLTGQSASGAACLFNSTFGVNQCSVDVDYDPVAQTLAVTIRKALSESTSSTGFQQFTLNYVVPVPAAAWLMLSAVGGLAAFRRRVAA